jgi:hypothetical protein
MYHRNQEEKAALNATANRKKRAPTEQLENNPGVYLSDTAATSWSSPRIPNNEGGAAGATGLGVWRRASIHRVRTAPPLLVMSVAHHAKGPAVEGLVDFSSPPARGGLGFTVQSYPAPRRQRHAHGGAHRLSRVDAALKFLLNTESQWQAFVASNLSTIVKKSHMLATLLGKLATELHYRGTTPLPGHGVATQFFATQNVSHNFKILPLAFWDTTCGQTCG